MKKRGIKFPFYLILGGFIIKKLSGLISPKTREKVQVNFKDFLEEEKDEVEDLVEGKKSIKKFCCDSGSLVKEYFIPYDGNENKPKILRAKSLALIVIGVILIKTLVTGYLFFIYPNKAIMSEIITDQILEMVNQDRIANSLKPLSINSALNKAAQAKAQDMLDYNYFAHKSLDGKMPWDWIDRGEYIYLFVGENLAMNFSSAQAAHNALMQSESHKKNILNDKYADIGIVVVSGNLQGKNTNILVQMFGYIKPQLAIAAMEPVKISVPEQPIAQLPVNPVVKEELTEEQSSDQEEEIIKEVHAQQEETVEIQPKEQTKVAAITTPVSQDIYTSPNLDIEKDKITQVMSVAASEDENITRGAKMINISHYIFIGILTFIVFALIINILIRVSIQHKSVIIQSLVVIIFIASLIYVRIHFLEQVLDKVTII